MKLYHFPPSPNSRRVLAVAYHLGLDTELIDVSLPKGEQMQPAFTLMDFHHSYKHRLPEIYRRGFAKS